MCDEEYADYLMEYYESLVIPSPFDGLTEEECEEFLREFNGEYEEEHRWSGRF